MISFSMPLLAGGEIANAGSDQVICTNSVTLAGNAPVIYTGLWTVVTGTGSFSDANDPSTSVSNLDIGETILVWEFYQVDVLISSDTVKITVQEPPIASAGIDQTICSSSANLDAVPATNGSWALMSGAGTLADNTLANTAVSDLAVGENVFRWTVPGGACADAFDEVSVFQDSPPTSSVAGSDQTICSTSTTLDANFALVGGGQWIVITGTGNFTFDADPQTVVSGLSTGINTFRWTISNGVCASSTDDVNITVQSPPTTPNAGTDQTICSSSAILDAVPATNGSWALMSGAGTLADNTLASTAVSNLILGENVFRWTVPGGACADAFDEVSIFQDAPPTNSSAGSDQTICSTSTTLDANFAFVGGGQWSVIAGTGNFTFDADPQTFVSGLSTGINTFRWTISNGVCAASTDDVNITVQSPPTTPNAGTDQTICSSSTTLNATAASGGSWTLISGSGTLANASSATSSVSGLSTGVNVIRWTVPGGTCSDVFDEVSITVDAPPTSSAAGSDQSICSTTATLSGNTPSSGTGLWSVITGTALFNNATSPSTSVSGLSVGINVLRWTISNGTCTPSSDDITITVDNNPASPNAGIDQTLCASSTNLAATPATGGAWTLVSGSGTIANASSATSGVTGLSNGVNVFRWTIPGGACGNVSDDVSITVDQSPTTSQAGSDQTICTTSTTLNANTALVGTGQWSIITGSGTFVSNSNPLTAVSGLSTGLNTFRWTISNGVCTASTDDVSITVQSPPSTPNAGTDQTICSSSATLNATAASGGHWTVISGSGNFSNANLANTNVTGLSNGANVFRWTVSSGVCADVSDDVTITVDTPPTSSSAGSDQSICSTTATLSGNTPSSGTGLWSVITGTALFNNATNPSTSVSGLSVGVNVLRWTISNGTCTPSSDDVTITVDNNPLSPNAGSDQQLCASSTSLAATPATGGAWTLVSGSGTLANASSATSGITGLSNGVNVFRWTIPGGACGDVFDEVSITVYAAPTSSSAGSDQSICSTTATLSGNTPSSGTGLWSVITGTALFNNATSPSTSVSGLSIGVNVLRWTISNGTCAPSSDDITITVDNNPASPNAGIDQTLCASSTNLAATPATGGAWTLVSGSGTIANATSATSGVTGLSNGVNVFRWTIPGGACGNVSDDLSITVYAAPTSSSAGSDQSICSTTATLSGNTPSSGTGLWSVITGTALFNNATNPSTSVSGLSVGVNVLRWTISNGTCTPSSDDITITVDNNPVSPNAGIDQTLCASSTNLAATPATGGAWTLLSGSGTLANASSANSSVTGLSVGVNVFRWTIPGGACGNVSDDVSITVDQSPTSSQAGLDQTICATSTTLGANTALIGTGQWSVISGSGTFVSNSNPLTAISGLSNGINTFRWTISNGVCTSSTDDVSITVQTPPTTPNAGTDQAICSSSATLNATAASGGHWTIISGSGNFSNSNLANTNVTGLSNGANVFRWTVSSGVCADVSDDVTITVDTPPTSSSAGSDQSICSTTATLSGNTPSSGTGLWSVITGTALFNNATNPSTSVSGLSVGVNVLRWTISNGTCTPSSDDVTITVDNNPLSPNAGSDQQLCASSTSLAATPATGGAWTLVSGSGTLANASSATSGVTGLSNGVSVFRWTIPGGACGNVSDEVSITVDSPPSTSNAGIDQSICSTVATLAANTPSSGTGLWTVVSGSGLFANANSPSTSVSGLSVGVNVLRWTISNGTCSASTDVVSITVDNNPVSPNAGPDQTLCASTTTLAATASSGGSWTLISGTGTIQNATSATSSVSGLSIGTNVFRWTIPGGACGNVSDDVSILVQAPPSVSVAGSDQVICTSFTSMAATAPTIGTGAWSVVSGSGLFGNANSATSSVTGLSSGNNVFRWTISNGVCSTSSDDVTITVSTSPATPNAGSDQTLCASSSTLSASPSGGIWTVVSGTATFQNASSATSSVSGLSTGINVLRWTIDGGACADVSDDITITVQSPPTTANAGSDQSICSTSATLNGNSPSTGTGLWTVISGTATFANASLANTTVTGLSIGTNILRWTISNGVCSASTDDVSIIVDSNPSTPSAGVDQTICSTSTQLSASPSGGTWTVVSGTANFQSTSSPTSTVTGLATGINILRWTITSGTCPSASDDVSITVQSQPSTALAGNDQTICSTTATLSGNTPTVGSGIWTVVSGTATFANATLPSTSVTGLSTGINILRWTISNGVCPTSSDDVSINVDSNPTTPSAGIDQTICSSSTQLSASPATGSWTVVSGSATFLNASLATSTVTGLAAGINVLRWTVTSGTCPSASDDITITVQTTPSTAAAGTDQTICSTSTTLSANSPINGTGSWSVISGTATFANTTLATTSITGLSVGNNVLRWTISNGVCPVSTDDVTILVDANPSSPSAGIDQTICTSSTQLSASPTGGIWTVISGAATFQNSSSATSNVTGLSNGVNILRWTITSGTCPSVFDEVSITVQTLPTTSAAGTDQSICSTNATLAANNASVGNGIWTVVNGSGTFANANSASSTVSGLTAGVNTFRWTISNGVCPVSSDDVVITVQTTPATPNAGADQSICSSSTNLSATAVSGAVWSVVSGSGTFANSSLANTLVTGLSNGLNVFRWTVSGGTCPNATDDVFIAVDQAPTVSNAGANQSICSTVTLLAANTPLIGSGVWSVVSGTGSFSNANNPQASVSGLSVGNNVLRWTISNGTCTPSQSTVTITVDNNPLSPNAGSDQIICSNSTTLSATAASGAFWSVISGSGTIQNTSNASTSVSGLSNGANVFRWTIPGASCGNVSDDVTIVVQSPPSTSAAGQDQTICSTSTSLAANNPITGNGTWTVISGSATFSNANSPTTTVSGLSTGVNVLRWSISNGVCTASTDDVTIIVTASPATPSAGSDQTICSSTTNVTASPAVGTWSLISGSGIISNPTSASTSITGLTAGTSIFRWTIDGGTCPDVSDDVSITIQALPTTSNAGSDQSICSTSASLSGNSPLSGSGTWTVVSGSGTFANATLFNTTVSGLFTGTNVFRWTISNGVCPVSFDDVSIIVDANPVNPSAGSDQTICSSTTQLSASPNGGTWSLVSGTATFQNSTSATSTVTGLQTGTNVLRWTVSSGSCPSVSDDVTITVQQTPTTANAGIDQTICTSSTTLNANVPSVGTGVWSVVSGAATFVNATSASTAISGLSSGLTILRWTISNGVCASSSDDVSILVETGPGTAFAGADQSVCSSTVTLAATPATGGLWSLISGSGTIANASLANTVVTGLTVGTSVFRWTVSSGSCASVSDEVSIMVNNPPSASNAGIDQTICLTSAALSANVPSTGTGVWSVISGSGFFANANLPNTSISGLSVGVNVLRWTISNSNCTPSTDEVSITVLQAPSNVQAGVDQVICGTVATLSATAPAQGSGHWTVVSGAGVFANANAASTSVTGISSGTNVYRWTVSNGSCATASDEITILSSALPTTSNAGSDQTICSNTATIQGNFATVGTGAWSVISGGGIIQNNSLPQTTVTNLQTGINVFRWTISNGTCSPSTDDVTINVIAPVVSNAGADQDICSTSATFQAVLPSGTTGLWNVVSGSGIIQTPSSPTSQISNLGIGANVFQWNVNNGVCPSATSTVTITRFADPSDANAGTDFQTCANSANLSANIPSIGTGFWSVVSGSGTFSNPTLATSAVTGLTAGINQFEWAISNGPCGIKRDTIAVTVDQNPTSAFAGSDQQLCASTATCTATAPSSGTGLWTLISGVGTIANPTLANTSLSNLGAGNNVFRWTISNGTCVTFDEVTITRFLPPSTAIAGTNLIICSSSASLSANIPVVGTGIWTVLSGSGTFAQASSATTTVNNLGAGANVLSWTISNGVCPASSDQVTIDQQQAPTPAAAGNDQEICASTAVLNANLPIIGNGVWSLLSGSGTLEDALSPTSTISGLGAGENVFQWSTLNGLCPASTDQVIITRDVAPSAAFAGIDISTCSNAATLSAQIPTIGTGVWTILTGSGNLSSSTSPDANISNLLIGETQLQWAVSNGVCPTSFDSISITAFASPAQAYAGIDETICSDSIFLVGNTSVGSNYSWEMLVGQADFEDSSSVQTAIINIAPGNNLIRYSISNGPCSTADSIQIFRYELPSPANAGTDSVFCSDQFLTQATIPLVGQGTWTSLSGEIVFSDSSLAQTSISGLVEGTNTLVWLVENGACPSNADTVNLMRDVPSEIASAMADTNVCVANLQIQALAPINAIGHWELISGDAQIVDSTLAQTEIGMSAEGENMLVWTLSEGSCRSSDSVLISFNYDPFPLFAGEDQSVCGLITNLEALDSGIGVGQWSLLLSDGTLSDPNDPNSTFSVDYAAQRHVIWTVVNGFCSASDTVNINFLDFPISDAGPDLIGCLGDTTALQAVIPDFGVGTWTVLTPGGNVFEPGFQNSNFTASEQGNYYVRWTVVNDVCRDSSYTVVTVYGPDDPECKGPDVVFIPEGFSPNNDGVLDKFVIVKPQTKRASLEVFDRYGILVYSNSDYQNDWDGTAQNGTILQGTQLPESTYYYLLKVDGETETRKGYFTLWR